MDSLAALMAQQPSRTYAEIGVALLPATVSKVPGATAAARVVMVELVPSGRVVTARVLNLGQGLGKGVFVPIMKGDELLILFPGGDPNRSVAIAGLGNGVNVNPLGNLGTKVLVQHPAGVTLGTVDGAPEYSIVHTEFLSGLELFLAQVTTFMTSVIAASALTPATAAVAAIGTAATAFNTNPDVLTFAAGVTASKTLGAPYSTILHKVT